MLESIDDAIASGLPRQGDSAFERAIRNVPFNVQIPRSKLEALGKSGPSTPMVTDQRRHIRFRQLKRCLLRYEATYPKVPRHADLFQALIINVSKEGIGLLHEEQLYPKERFHLRVEGYGLLRLTVARCQKLGPRCYEIGAVGDRPLDVKTLIGL
ncbi:hypothetical protein ACYFX5_06570 [Bremerella sp. T1]|uniref:hypothetical protein n=1 Tax=Bremerella sp. TYQ1 TaxID=3119568 RepID=UPI001CC95398|nr:hypothetical protein [Bremerella volcania]UBM37920.1 hypothetical protein LA756_08510 [Bremerella volcania]